MFSPANVKLKSQKGGPPKRSPVKRFELYHTVCANLCTDMHPITNKLLVLYGSLRRWKVYQ